MLSAGGSALSWVQNPAERLCRAAGGRQVRGSLWGEEGRRPRGAGNLANPAAGTREGCELGLAKFP